MMLLLSVFKNTFALDLTKLSVVIQTTLLLIIFYFYLFSLTLKFLLAWPEHPYEHFLGMPLLLKLFMLLFTKQHGCSTGFISWPIHIFYV